MEDVKGRLVVTRRNEIYRSSVHPLTIRRQIRVTDNFCKITSKERDYRELQEPLSSTKNEKIILERNISGNYLQDEQLGGERKPSGFLSVTEIGQFEEEKEEGRMIRVR